VAFDYGKYRMQFYLTSHLQKSKKSIALFPKKKETAF